MTRILLLFSIALLSRQPGLSQEVPRLALRGSVMSGDDAQPVAGATILLKGTVYGTTTDAAGQFIFKNIPEGTYTLEISMIGFTRLVFPVQVQRGDSSIVALKLWPAPFETAPVIVTASKRDQSLEEVPVSVSVVDDKMLSVRNTVTIDDALRYVPGVNLTHSQVNVRGSTGYSYGVGSRVLLLVDGEPLLTGDTGEIVWESIPTVTIDRVEIVKGAGSALYGSNALGGVINVITKKATEEPQTRVRLYGGIYQMPEYQEWKWSDEPRPFSGIMASHQERIGGWTLSLGGSRTTDDGYKRNDYWKRWNAWSRVGYEISTFQSIDVSFSVLDQRRGNFLYWKDINHVLEPKDDQLSQRVQSLRWSANAGYRCVLSSELSATAHLTMFRSHWENNISSQFAPAGDDSRSDNIAGELQCTYLAGAGHILTFGMAGNTNSVDATSIFGNHRSLGGALYVQDEMDFLRTLRLTVGSRYDYQKMEGIDPFSQLDPKIGVVYSVGGSTSVRASAGRGFRAPSIAEAYTTTEAGGLTILPNQDLQPERSWSYELGGMHTVGSTCTIDLAIFRNEFWNLIEPSFAADGYVHFQNITRARITGGECSLRLEVVKGIVPAQIGYTYVYPEDVTRGDILKYRPRHLLYVSLQGIVQPVTLGVDARFISRTERIDDELVLSGTVPDGDRRVPIRVVDVRVGASSHIAGLAVNTTFHVNNVFQYFYTDFIGNLGPTRNYVLTIESTLP